MDEVGLDFNTIKNLAVLARQGIGAIGANIDSDQALVAWEAIGQVEKFIQHVESKQKIEEPNEPEESND